MLFADMPVLMSLCEGTVKGGVEGVVGRGGEGRHEEDLSVLSGFMGIDDNLVFFYPSSFSSFSSSSSSSFSFSYYFINIILFFAFFSFI